MNKKTEILTELFDECNIPRVKEIVSAWNLLSDENPGVRRHYEFEGKDVYVLLEQMEELGLYKVETREEEW